MTFRHALTAAALFAVLGGSEAAAQFACGAGCQVISGTVSDATTGPLVGGNVYIVTGSLTVLAGQTWTIPGGTILKFVGASILTTAGTLNVNGTPGNEAIFTSIRDDVAGDHNNDGAATSPAAGDWGRLNFTSTSDASVVTGAIVRYAGVLGVAAIDLSASNLTLTSCVVSSVAGPCLGLTNASLPTVSGCSFQTGTVAVSGATLQAVPGFTGCTAFGNSVYDAIQVSSANLSANLSLAASNTLNGDGAVVLASSVFVLPGATLTLGAGMTFKFLANLLVDVNGVLVANGAAGAPVVFTSVDDDAHAGDTNKNGGATAAAPGQWGRLDFGTASDASSLTHAVVRAAGAGGFAAVDLDGANVALTSVSTALLAGPCLDLKANSFPTVTDCALNGGTKAATGVPLGALPGFSGNTAAGNAVFDAPEITSATPTGSLTIGPDDSFNADGVLVLSAGITVPAATTLTLAAGTTVKFASNQIVDVNGVLQANGAAGSPVVFTSIHDDAYGGDTNKNGAATVPAPGQWGRLDFSSASDASTLDFVVVRAAGGGGLGAFDLDQCDATLRDCETALLGGPALDLKGSSAPTVVRCALNGGQRPVANASLKRLAGFRFCTAAGNAVENATRITAASLFAGESATLDKINSMNGDGVFVSSSAVSVPVGAALNVGRGVRLKFTTAATSDFSGSVSLRGTGGDPVVFTSIHDDSVGGDTNLNGSATAPAAGQIGRVRFQAAATGLAEHVRVRFGGAAANPGFECASAAVAVRAVRADFSAGDGLRVTDAAGGVCDNLVAWNSALDGIEYDNSVSLRHATSALNAQFGLRGLVATPGTVVNGVVFGNTAGATTSVPAAQVSFTCGVAGGGPGNIVADPLFVDGPNGDLRLQPASPCVDAADALTGFLVVEDHVEASRLGDGKLLATPFPDMGAYELSPFAMTVVGEPWSGTVVTIEVVGPPGVAAIAIGNLFGTELLLPYGFSLADPLAFLVPLAFVGTNAPFAFPMPDVSGLAGTPFGMQALATTLADPSKGGFTNLYRGALDG